MKQDQWDDIIRNKMQSFRVDETPKDWSLFEEKLTLAQGEPARYPDESFDQLVFRKLNHFEAPTDSKEQHWQLFERQLYYLAHLRQRLLQYKFIEIAALTLLLLYVIEADAPGNISLPSALADSESISNNLPFEQGHSTTATASSGVSGKETPQPPITVTELISTQVGEPTITTDPKDQLLIQTAALASTPTTLASLSGANPSLPAIQLATDPNASWTVLKVLPGASIVLADQRPDLFIDISPAPTLSIHISMLGGADYNLVMTPENLPAGINAFERYSTGYRGGLLADFGRQDGRLRLGSGFIYTAKRYEVGYKRIQGSFLRRGGLTSESLSDIEINILNIPVFARWDVWQGNHWSLFAHGGFALQVALQTNYYAGYSDNFPLPADINRTPDRYSPLKDRNGGLLEGGNFKENGFFSSQVGLGIERRMADRWNLFFQSRYEHSMGYLSAGLGPTQDRINTFSLETGIRVQLK